MDATSLREIQTNDVVRKRLAKLIAMKCFRWSKLEDLHAASGANKITDAEMKTLRPARRSPHHRVDNAISPALF